MGWDSDFMDHDAVESSVEIGHCGDVMPSAQLRIERRQFPEDPCRPGLGSNGEGLAAGDRGVFGLAGVSLCHGRSRQVDTTIPPVGGWQGPDCLCEALSRCLVVAQHRQRVGALSLDVGGVQPTTTAAR